MTASETVRDGEKRPDWEWLEQLALADESALCVRVDDADRMREFRVDVEEIDLGQTFSDIEQDPGIEIESDTMKEAERLVEEMEEMAE